MDRETAIEKLWRTSSQGTKWSEVANAYDAGVAAERERCATIARDKAWHCEEHDNQYGKTAALDIEAAIRGMGPN